MRPWPGRAPHPPHVWQESPAPLSATDGPTWALGSPRRRTGRRCRTSHDARSVAEAARPACEERQLGRGESLPRELDQLASRRRRTSSRCARVSKHRRRRAGREPRHRAGGLGRGAAGYFPSSSDTRWLLVLNACRAGDPAPITGTLRARCVRERFASRPTRPGLAGASVAREATGCVRTSQLPPPRSLW